MNTDKLTLLLKSLMAVVAITLSTSYSVAQTAVDSVIVWNKDNTKSAYLLRSTSSISFDDEHMTVAAGSSVHVDQIDCITFSDPVPVYEGDWMGRLADNTPFAQLTVPGTHDAATSKCSVSSAKCQSLTIAEQLVAGVRAFDLRPRYKADRESDITLDNLEIYHGSASTGVKFKDAMDVMVAFVRQHPSETVYVNIQKEDATFLFTNRTDYSPTWRTSIRTYLQNNADYLVHRITSGMTLGECRGKLVVVSRNPYGSENVYNDVVYGGLLASWGDNAQFDTQINHTWNGKLVDVTAEDRYNQRNTDTKYEYIAENLRKAAADKSSRWYYTFCNLATSPRSYATTVNPKVSELLSDASFKGGLGLVFIDFAGDASVSGDVLLHNIILQNFK